jgi:hypothetical protein
VAKATQIESLIDAALREGLEKTYAWIEGQVRQREGANRAA